MLLSIIRRTIPFGAVGLMALLFLPLQVHGQQAEQTGRLHVLWEDSQDGGGRVHYYLADDLGAWTELRVSDGLIGPSGSLLSLDGQRIRVTGSRIEGLAATGAASLLDVDQLYPISTVQPFDPIDRGDGPWVTILCRFADSNSTPHAASWYEQLMGTSNPGLVNYWTEVSYGQHDVSGSVVVGWKDLPEPRSAYYEGGDPSDPDLTKLKDDCAGTADDEIHFPSFAGVHLQFNETIGCCSWGGSGWLELDGEARFYPMTWLAPWADQHTFAHEMGHGIGMPHSSGPYNKVYDSNWDVMSLGHNHRDGTFGWIAPHAISYQKNLVGWIAPSRVYMPSPGSSATIRLHRLGEPASGTDFSLAEIPLENGEYYTVEARRFVGYDGDLPGEAVIIHHVDPDRPTGSPANVVDPDNDGNPNDDGAMWLPGETFEDKQAGVTVRVTAQTSTGFDVRIAVDGVGEPTPLIALTPTTLSFATVEGQVPPNQDLTVQNSGDGTLVWSATTNRTWISLSKTSGSLSGGASWSVSVSVDAGSLSAGTHTGTISVTGNAANSPQDVAVQVTVTPVEAPLITLRPGSLAYDTPVDQQPGAKSLTIQNSGTGTLNWTTSANRSWIGLASSSGSLAAGASETIAVELDVTGMSAGSYSGKVTVTGNADNSPQELDIALTIAAPEVPLIALIPASLTYATNTGADPAPQDFSVENSGQGTLEWSAATDRGWLSANPPSGSLAAGATADVTISVDVSGLAAGVYPGTVTVSGNTVNSPQKVAVELQVTDSNDPLIAVSPSSMVVQTKGGGKKIPTPNLGIGNAGGETLSWNGTTDRAWFKLAKESGSLKSGATDSVALLLALDGLEPGTYQGTITVSGNASNSPHTIPVELKLTNGAVVKIRRGKLTYAGFEDEQPMAKSFTMANEGDETSNWSASADQEWILLASTSGTLPEGDTQRVGVSVDIAGLDPGNHHGSITIVGDEDLESLTLDVSLTVSNGPGVKHSVDDVVSELLDRTNQLGPSEIHYLDHVGNGNGQFDVGDLRAWLMQRGELSGAPPLTVISSGSSTSEESERRQAESETRATASSIQGRAQ